MDKQVLKLGARVLENLPVLSSDVIQGWIDNPKALKHFLSGLAPEEATKLYLRHLKTVTLAPAKGSATLAKAREVFVFTGSLDNDFKKWGTDVGSEDTTETKVSVYEMTRNGNFQTLFGSLGDPRKLCLTWEQIVEFCRSYRFYLRQEDHAVFFLFEVNDEMFVVYVLGDADDLWLRVYRFDFAHVWSAGNRHQLVVQQQTV